MEYPTPIKALIESFQLLPGIGKKTAERLAIYVFSNFSDEQIKTFANNIENVKISLKNCQICGNLCENDLCEICSDDKRDNSTVMVIENIKDLFAIEKTNEFNGVYHVLGGAISFQKGIGIKDINLESLIERVKTGNIKEIIIATNANLEGETTARYIKVLLEDFDVKISRIAFGIPVGSDLEYADELTLLKALEGRIKY